MGSNRKKAPYGTWSSPITAEAITKKSITVLEALVDPVTSDVYHTENRDGASILVHTASKADLTTAEVNVRTGVHEYGGAAELAYNGTIYFSNYKDHRVYKVEVVKPNVIAPVVPENKAHRFADFTIHPKHPHILVAILEDHTNDTPQTVINTLCTLNTNTGVVSPLISGADFYKQPRFSPSGSHLVWQQWDHPDMEWTGGQVKVAEVVIDLRSAVVSLKNEVHVAGKKTEVSAGYPSWISDDVVIFTSDISGYQNPWKYVLSTGTASPIFAEPIKEDFSEPGWILGWSFYAHVGGNFVVFSSLRNGCSQLYVVDVSSGSKTELDTPYSHIGNMRTLSTTSGSGSFIFLGSKVDEPESLVKCTISLSSTPSTSLEALKSAAGSFAIPKELVSKPVPITFSLPGPNGEEPLYAIYYPPHNSEYEGSNIEGEKPPCVVNSHGGPTGASLQVLTSEIQYFTSRGWAWLDIEYRGSYGYGRAYIQRLQGVWGVLDISDTIAGAKLLSSSPSSTPPGKGLVDPKRLVTRGKSSGGFITLGCISTAHGDDVKTFAAATSRFGISDLVGLAKETHKFELRYPVGLIGGTVEEIEGVYKERSPVYNAERIVTPLLLLQGSEDRVVPKPQADAIYESITSRGGVVEYKVYSGEGHDFRMEATKADSLDRERLFYEKMLKIGT